MINDFDNSKIKENFNILENHLITIVESIILTDSEVFFFFFI